MNMNASMNLLISYLIESKLVKHHWKRIKLVKQQWNFDGKINRIIRQKIKWKTPMSTIIIHYKAHNGGVYYFGVNVTP